MCAPDKKVRESHFRHIGLMTPQYVMNEAAIFQLKGLKIGELRLRHDHN
jgi:hypothetical protein